MTLRQRIGLGVMQNMSGMQIKQDLTVFVPVQALSVTLRQRTLDSALRNVGKLKAAVDKCKATDAQRLRNEYDRLLGGLQASGFAVPWVFVERHCPM